MGKKAPRKTSANKTKVLNRMRLDPAGMTTRQWLTKINSLNHKHRRLVKRMEKDLEIMGAQRALAASARDKAENELRFAIQEVVIYRQVLVNLGKVAEDPGTVRLARMLKAFEEEDASRISKQK